MRVRDAIRDLPASRIAEISALGMGDPAVIPLGYGEGDLPTPAFIGAATTGALEAGHTFYTYKARPTELRYDMPEHFIALTTYPLTLSGKILKRELVEWAKSGGTAPLPVRWTGPKEG